MPIGRDTKPTARKGGTHHSNTEIDTMTQHEALADIKRSFDDISATLFTVNPVHSGYESVTLALTALAERVHNYDGDNDDMWVMGESGETSMIELLTGAYWHYSEWHAGMSSPGYRALSALGLVYSPGMEDADDENPTYQALNHMANELFLVGQ